MARLPDFGIQYSTRSAPPPKEPDLEAKRQDLLTRVFKFLESAYTEGRNVLPDATDDQAAVIESWAQRAMTARWPSTLIDIADMPGFDPAALTDDAALDRVRSVSRGVIYFGLPPSGQGLETVCCVIHGATLCVGRNEHGTIWRCPACNEGAFSVMSP